MLEHIRVYQYEAETFFLSHSINECYMFECVYFYMLYVYMYVHAFTPPAYDLSFICNKVLGPVVQSIVSLTSSLRGQLVKCFMTLSPNTLIFFAEKMREAFALQKLLTFFQQKYWHI